LCTRAFIRAYIERLRKYEQTEKKGRKKLDFIFERGLIRKNITLLVRVKKKIKFEKKRKNKKKKKEKKKKKKKKNSFAPLELRNKLREAKEQSESGGER